MPDKWQSQLLLTVAVFDIGPALRISPFWVMMWGAFVCSEAPQWRWASWCQKSWCPLRVGCLGACLFWGLSVCCLFWALSAWCDLILVMASPLAWLQPGFRVLLDSQHHQLPSVALFLPAGISEFWAVWVPRETQEDWSSQDRKPRGQWEAQRSQQLLPVWAFSQGARTSPRWPLFPSQAHSHFFPPSEVLCWVPLL